MNEVKTTAKDFFINLGAIVALYTSVISLINLLFTVINRAYPQVGEVFYSSSASISWPVAILIIFFPIYLLLMWFLEKGYATEPERRNLPVRRWLTYITLFVAGLVLSGDLVAVLYYFIDGQELTFGFLLKIASVFLVALMVFAYYINDVLNRNNGKSKKIWTLLSLVVVMFSIVWGFSVLGSPRTQRLYKYDQEKINGLSNLSNQIELYYTTNGKLPDGLNDMKSVYYVYETTDPQSGKSYEYTKKDALNFELCAEFNKASQESLNSKPQYSYDAVWTHSAGRYCFTRKINPQIFQKAIPEPNGLDRTF